MKRNIEKNIFLNIKYNRYIHFVKKNQSLIKTDVKTMIDLLEIYKQFIEKDSLSSILKDAIRIVNFKTIEDYASCQLFLIFLDRFIKAIIEFEPLFAKISEANSDDNWSHLLETVNHVKVLFNTYPAM